MSLVTITKDNVKEIKKDKEAVIEFWAPWCGYCKRLAPALTQLAEEYADKVTIYQVNIDEFGEISEEYEIDTIPTLISLQDGKKDKELIAPQAKSEITAWLKDEKLINDEGDN